MNKNISVWRGTQPPPTKYHIWLKSDGSINIFNENKWERLTDGIKSAIQNINVNEITDLQYLYDNHDVMGSYFYRIYDNTTNDYISLKYPYIFGQDKIAINKLCYFNKINYSAAILPNTRPSQPSPLSYDKYYHIVFGNKWALTAIDNNDCRTQPIDPCDNKQLWKFENNDSIINLVNKNGDYLRSRPDQISRKPTFVCTTNTIYNSENCDKINFELIVTDSGYELKNVGFAGSEHVYLNVNQEVANNHLLIGYSEPTVFNIMKFDSIEFTEQLHDVQYILEFPKKKDNKGSVIITYDSEERLTSNYFTDISDLKCRWQFEGTTDNFKIRNVNNKKYVIETNDGFKLSDTEATFFKLVVHRGDDGYDYYKISLNNKYFNINSGIVGNNITLWQGYDDINSLLHFKLIKKDALIGCVLGDVDDSSGISAELKIAMLENQIDVLQYELYQTKQSLIWEEG